MNIAQVLKAEISRISKREAKALSSPTRKTAIQLKKTVADLKSRLSILEKTGAELQKQIATLIASQPKPVEQPEDKTRITGKGVKTLRKKLKVTQEEFGKLTGVSAGAVRIWESKSGTLKLRDATKKALMAVRGISKAEARKRLDELGKTIKLDKSHKNPYLKLKKANVVAKKKALDVVKRAVKKAGLKRRK